jgi:hypothetical protein
MATEEELARLRGIEIAAKCLVDHLQMLVGCRLRINEGTAAGRALMARLRGLALALSDE